MIARDVMTRDVVSVGSDTPMRKIAALLVEKGISAVPVVDSGGVPIGIVSEGDLIGRKEAEREARGARGLVVDDSCRRRRSEPRFSGKPQLSDGARLDVGSGDRSRRGDKPPRDCADPDDTPHKARAGRL